MPAFQRPVFVLGAGATKACGGPLTWEILPKAFAPDAPRNREDMLHRLEVFLREQFHVPLGMGAAPPADLFPDLPLLMSMLDDAINQDRGWGKLTAAEVRDVRVCLDYAIFAVIEHSLHRLTGNPHTRLLGPLYDRNIEPTIISFNYDVIVDNTMMQRAEGTGRTVSYDVDVASESYRVWRDRGTLGRLLKPHGSMNWMYCPVCERLDLYYSEQTKRFGKAMEEFYYETSATDPYRCTGSPCRDPACRGRVQPTMITPTQRKQYRNRHLARTWERSLEALRAADRVVIVGYSMPADDVEVVSLLKQGLLATPQDRITVVEYAQTPTPMHLHAAGKRYRSILGPGVGWTSDGFEKWVDNEWKAEMAAFGP